MEWLKVGKGGVRIVEICVSVVAMSWVVARLPMLLCLLKQAWVLVCSPLFVFLLSNAIIATLFLNHSLLSTTTSSPPPLPHHDHEHVVFQDKHILLSHPNPSIHQDDKPNKPHIIPATTKHHKEDTSTLNSHSHHSPNRNSSTTALSQEITPQSQEPPHRLGRSQSSMQKQNIMYPHDHLSSEEFQRTVEAFIANQLTFRRQESFSSSSLLLHNHSHHP